MSARPTLNTLETREIVERIKDIINIKVNKKGLTYDYMVAKELDISLRSLEDHIKADTLPLFHIAAFCESYNQRIDELIY